MRRLVRSRRREAINEQSMIGQSLCTKSFEWCVRIMRPTHDVAPGDLARVSIAPRNLRSSVPGGELLSKVATISTGASHRLIARKRRSSFGSSTNRRWILRNETPDAPLSRSRLEVRSVVRTRALSSVPRGKAVLRTVPGAATRRAQQRRTRQVVPFQELVYGRRESDGPSAPWRWLRHPHDVTVRSDGIT